MDRKPKACSSRWPDGLPRRIVLFPEMSRKQRIQATSRPAPLEFRRAIKRDAKVRLAITGPSGSGKTYTLLKIASELGGPIALVDTERGSAEKYADLFEFDTLPLESFSPDLVPRLIETRSFPRLPGPDHRLALALLERDRWRTRSGGQGETAASR